MHKILIATSTFARHSKEPLYLLKKRGINIFENPFNRKLTTNEINSQANGAAGIIAGTETYSKETLDKLLNLKVLSRVGVGMDNIDIKTAKKRGIKVFRTKTTPAPAVAELTLGLMLDVARKISDQNQNLKSNIWKKEMGNILQGKTLGIIGLGTIGKTLINLLNGFNFNILAYDIQRDNEFAKDYKVMYCDINTLLVKSDIISVHLNLSVETKGFLDKKRLNKMKRNSILINTSRGEIIDEKALYLVLREEKIWGAGLDVYNEEPYQGPLCDLHNVVLTPHIGAYAKEIRIKMELEATKNLIKGLNNV